MEEQYLKNMRDYLEVIDEVIEKGPYKDDWETMLEHKVPEWYQNAKLGIFIHWGPYSVAEFDNVWYPRLMYQEGKISNSNNNCFKFHEETFGKHKEFGYKDFVPLFKAEKFNPSEWLDLFEEAGARFVMPVAEHHDGFQMYDSNLSDWCSTKMGPMRDVVADIKDEVEKRGMHLATATHRAEHYWFMSPAKNFDSDMEENPPYSHIYWPSIKDPFDTLQDVDTKEPIDVLFMEDWLVRTCELADKYQPSIMYFDWWIQVADMRPYLKKFAAYYYNRALEWGKDVTINYKNDAFMHSVGVKDIERGQLSGISPRFWQNDTSTAKNSWCYAIGNDYKEADELICDLVDIVSKNGSLLLNVGPRGDGSIGKEDTQILKEIGKWMKVNSEAIYDTTHWRKYGEGPTVTQEGHRTDTLRKGFTSEDFRFTFKKNALYVFSMKWPEDGVVRIKTLAREGRTFNAIIKSVEVLGATQKADFVLCDEHLSVMCDGVKPTNQPVCIKIVID